MGVVVNRALATMCASVFRRLRPWHIGCTFALFGMSCVLPETLDPEADTNVNYPPAIVSTDPPSTGFVTIPMSTGRDFILTLSDANVSDVLHVRFFVDYSSPMGTPAGPIVDVDIPAGTMAQRPSVTNPLTCESSRVPPTGTHYVTAVVADRPFLSSTQQPIFRAVPPDGFTAEVTWTVTCTNQ
jgi:hypothetical protein